MVETFICDNCGEEIDFEIDDEVIDCTNCLMSYNIYEAKKKIL